MAKIRTESKFTLVLIAVITMTLLFIGGLQRFEVRPRVTILDDKNESTLDISITTERPNDNTNNVRRSFNATDRHPCKIVVPKLSKTPLPVTGLVSFQGSGNTWTRHLIQQATGLATASVYCDGSLRKSSFPFECHRNFSQVVAVKSHRTSRDKFTQVILILRNPVNTLLAFFNYKKAGHTGTAPASAYAKKWRTFFTIQLNAWSTFYQKWLCNFTGPLYPILYENLLKDPYTELKSLFKFLGLRINESSLLCTVQNQEGNFHRNNTTNISTRPKYTFSEEMLANITVAAQNIAKCFHARYDIAWDYYPKKISEISKLS